MILSLGPHVFDILPVNLQSIERALVMNWPAISRFGGAPARQYVGEGEHTIRLTGLVFPEAFGGYEEYEALRATVLAAQPVIMLGLGAGLVGTVFGLVVITGVRDRQDHLAPDGIGRRLAFDIEVAPKGGDEPYGGLF